MFCLRIILCIFVSVFRPTSVLTKTAEHEEDDKTFNFQDKSITQFSLALFQPSWMFFHF